jgi:hypothetical protein
MWTTFDTVITCLVWALIPAVLLLKRYLDWRHDKVCRETQPAIDAEIERIGKRLAEVRRNRQAA